MGVSHVFAGGNNSTMRKQSQTLEEKLILAAKQGDLKSVSSYLCNLHRQVDVNAKDGKGNTALSYATYFGHIDIVERLLKATADVNATNDDGYTPLMFAAYNGNVELVALLLCSGASVSYKDGNGCTALYWAKHRKHEGVSSLIQHYINYQLLMKWRSHQWSYSI
jgi:ankyrin repeat protein